MLRRPFTSLVRSGTLRSFSSSPSSRVFRISERFVSPAQHETLQTLMGDVERELKRRPGLTRIETLESVDEADACKLTVISEWSSREAMESWLNSETCRKVVHRLDKALDAKPTYRVLEMHPDDVFDPMRSLEL